MLKNFKKKFQYTRSKICNDFFPVKFIEILSEILKRILKKFPDFQINFGILRKF